jgi:hypothetical protein
MLPAKLRKGAEVPRDPALEPGSRQTRSACCTWFSFWAELLFVPHALAHQPIIQHYVVGVLHFLSEKLFLTLPAQLCLLVPLPHATLVRQILCELLYNSQNVWTCGDEHANAPKEPNLRSKSGRLVLTRHAWMRPSPGFTSAHRVFASGSHAAYRSASVRKSFAACPHRDSFLRWSNFRSKSLMRSMCDWAL